MLAITPNSSIGRRRPLLFRRRQEISLAAGQDEESRRSPVNWGRSGHDHKVGTINEFLGLRSSVPERRSELSRSDILRVQVGNANPSGPNSRTKDSAILGLKPIRPTLCAFSASSDIEEEEKAQSVGLIGFNPSIAESLVRRIGPDRVRITDLNSQNSERESSERRSGTDERRPRNSLIVPTL